MNSQASPNDRDPASVMSAIGVWWKGKMATMRESDALQSIGRNEFATMAQDLGLSLDELQDFASKGVHAADEAPLLIAALDIDSARIERAVYTDILRGCMNCDEKRRCKRELNAGEAASHFEEYCLNAHTLNALRAITSNATVQAG